MIHPVRKYGSRTRGISTSGRGRGSSVPSSRSSSGPSPGRTHQHQAPRWWVSCDRPLSPRDPDPDTGPDSDTHSDRDSHLCAPSLPYDGLRSMLMPSCPGTRTFQPPLHGVASQMDLTRWTLPPYYYGVLRTTSRAYAVHTYTWCLSAEHVGLKSNKTTSSSSD